MAEAHLVYELKGGISEIDVFKLAPTLLSLGNLIQESNRELFPDSGDLAVNAKPFQEGSFIIALNLVSPSHLHQLVELLKPHSLEQLEQLLECIGLIGGGTIGAVRAIQLLKGKPKAVEPLGANEVRYTAKDGSSFTVKSAVNSLLSNNSIVQNIYSVYAPPMLDQPEIESIKTFYEEHEEQSVTITREELPALEEFKESSQTLAGPDQSVTDIIHQGVLLNPKRGAFGNDGKDWSFWRGDGIITANVKDRAFLAKIASGELRLNESDLLTVTLLEYRKLRGTTILKPTYDVTQVTEYKRGPIQPKLIS